MGIAVGVTVAALISLAVIIFFLFRRARRLRQKSVPSSREDQSTPDTTGEKGQNIYVEQEIEGHRQTNRMTPLRIRTMGIDQFQSMHVEDIGDKEPAPYIPPRSPSRLVARGQEFF